MSIRLVNVKKYYELFRINSSFRSLYQFVLAHLDSKKKTRNRKVYQEKYWARDSDIHFAHISLYSVANSYCRDGSGVSGYW